MKNVVIIIPARYASSRLPGKPLISIAGVPLIVRVYQRARQIRKATEVLVATDDERIAEVVRQHGGQAVQTPEDLPSGTDRVGWVARKMESEIVVNLQGDEPVVDVQAIDAAIEYMLKHPDTPVATLGFPLRDKTLWRDEHVVKVLTNQDHQALYFSRSPIPFFRDEPFRPVPVLFQHLGVYLFRRDFLLNYLEWEPSPLEQAEKLEQLRILHHGYPIRVFPAAYPSVGVDTADDVRKVEQLLEREQFE